MLVIRGLVRPGTLVIRRRRRHVTTARACICEGGSGDLSAYFGMVQPTNPEDPRPIQRRRVDGHKTW